MDAILNRHLIAVVTGIASLVVVVASLATQACMTLTLELLPWFVAVVPGFWCTVLLLPGVAAAFVGIVGTPFSFPALIWSAVMALWEEGHGLGSFLWNLIRYILTIVLPRLPAVSFCKRVILKEECALYPPSAWQLQRAVVTDEIWIYINGVATTRAIGEANCRLLCLMFGRPVHHVHNPTDGMVVDVLECAVDKVGILNWLWETEPKELLIRTLRVQLQRARDENKTRVVLIAYSQGTIITSKALAVLGRDPEICRLMRELLEVYCIANCAHVMPENNLKLLESISNGRDTVANLGQLFPFPSFWLNVDGQGIEIDGAKVVEPLLWGHLLNTHYLFPMWYDGRYRRSQLVVNYMRPRVAGNPALLLT